MNTEKILEIASILEKVEPKTFHMSSWFAKLVPAVEMFDAEISNIFDDDELVPQYISYYTTDIDKIIDTKNSPDNTLALSCGTTACIAGWVIANEYFQGNKEPFISYTQRSYDVVAIASELLGITTEQGSRLFFCNTDSVWWDCSQDYDYGDKYDPEIPETWDVHPKIAADLLRRIVKGEVEL